MIWITACIPGSMAWSGITFSATRAGSGKCARSTGSSLRSDRICTRTVYTAGNMRERLTRTCADDAVSIISSIMGLRISSGRNFSIQSDHFSEVSKMVSARLLLGCRVDIQHQVMAGSMSRYVSHDDSPRHVRGEEGGVWERLRIRRWTISPGFRTGIETRYSAPGTGL